MLGLALAAIALIAAMISMTQGNDTASVVALVAASLLAILRLYQRGKAPRPPADRLRLPQCCQRVALAFRELDGGHSGGVDATLLRASHCQSRTAGAPELGHNRPVRR